MVLEDAPFRTLESGLAAATDEKVPRARLWPCLAVGMIRVFEEWSSDLPSTLLGCSSFKRRAKGLAAVAKAAVSLLMVSRPDGLADVARACTSMSPDRCVNVPSYLEVT